MGRRAKHWLHVLLDSGLPGLAIVIAACLAATYWTAQTVSEDEHTVALLVASVGAIVAVYRVWNTNRKQRNGNG